MRCAQLAAGRSHPKPAAVLASPATSHMLSAGQASQWQWTHWVKTVWGALQT